MRARREVTQAEFAAYVRGMKVQQVLISEPPCFAYYFELEADGGPNILAIQQLVSHSSIPGPDRYFILDPESGQPGPGQAS